MKENIKKFWKNINLQNIFMVTIILIVPIFLIGFFLYKTQISHPAQAQLLPYSLNETKTEDVSLGESLPIKIKSKEPSPTETPILEIHIANNGALLLRGAKVISISNTTIYVITAWDKTNFNWEIRTNPFAKFSTSKGEKLTLTDIKIDDILTVTGQLIEGGAKPIINGQFIRK
jgi:hypothetical protein